MALEEREHTEPEDQQVFSADASSASAEKSHPDSYRYYLMLRGGLMNYRFAYLLCLIIIASATSSFGDQAVGFKKQNQKDSLVYYSGTLILEGDFTYSKSQENQEMIGDQVCFTPSKKDGKSIPRENDKRAPWFCFKDSKRTKDVLGITGLLNDPTVCSVTGRATLEISDYVVDRAETNTNDTAELVRVITLSKPTTKVFSNSGRECI